MPKHVEARPIDEARALSMLRAGRSPMSTARALRVATRRIVELADRRGVPHSAVPSFSLADEARGLAELRAGRTVREIARGLCVCDETVYALLRLLGEPIPARPLSGSARAAESRAIRARDREDRPRFTCARCGREYEAAETADAPTGPAAPRCARFVLIGGRTWCERCAAARYPRRRDPDCPHGADYVEIRHQAPVSLRLH